MDTKTIIMIIMGVVIAILSYFLVRSYTADVEEDIKIVTDTVFLHSTDTCFVYKENIQYKEIRAVDTIYVTDTILIREQKIYEDSLSKIWLSGVDPELDSICYYIPRDTVLVNTTQTVTIHKKQGWGQFVGIGAGVGYGLSLGPTPHFEPYVGVTVTYGLAFHF